MNWPLVVVDPAPHANAVETPHQVLVHSGPAEGSEPRRDTVHLGRVEPLLQALALVSAAQRRDFANMIVTTPEVRVHDALVARCKKRWRALAELVWPRPLLCLGAPGRPKKARRRPSRDAPPAAKCAAAEDGFGSPRELERTRRAQPRACMQYAPTHPRFSPDDECHLCCDGAATAFLPCQHSMCAPCAYRLGRGQPLRCPFCKRECALNECVRVDTSM